MLFLTKKLENSLRNLLAYNLEVGIMGSRILGYFFLNSDNVFCQFKKIWNKKLLSNNSNLWLSSWHIIIVSFIYKSSFFLRFCVKYTSFFRSPIIVGDTYCHLFFDKFEIWIVIWLFLIFNFWWMFSSNLSIKANTFSSWPFHTSYWNFKEIKSSWVWSWHFVYQVFSFGIGIKINNKSRLMLNVC